MFKLKSVNLIDLEATCYPGAFPEGQTQEIIEIGIASVDLEKLKVVDGESILVKPTISLVSDYCTKLTGHTTESLSNGLTTAAAFKILVDKYDSENRLWLSQGNWDRLMFKVQCQNFDVDYPFGLNHMNFATFYSLLTGHRRHLGMVKQLQKLKMPLEGQHHNGYDDAKNIANMFIHILKLTRFSTQ